VIRAGITIFQHICRAPGATLGSTCYTMFLRKAAAEVIKPEILTPTEGAAAQHSPCTYLQTRDWMVLQSMSLNPKDYGWTQGVHGYEPVLTVDLMGPEELLQFTSCNCSRDSKKIEIAEIARRMMLNAFQHVEPVKELLA
jgi:hypothetical protein